MKLDKGYLAFGLVLVVGYLTCDHDGFVWVASLMFLGLGISLLAKKRR